ncbi:MAG: type I-U CRISPR-associated protein Cas7 [Myxococcales bacterium]|jgi:CRISPR-associated protein Csb1|nr:type I-U CRISPR-associated protein Cas7 [Myxococcales bacterium]
MNDTPNSERQPLDTFIEDSGPAALVLREDLVPVEGPDGVLFPPTFAAGTGFAGGYNIDGDPKGKNICIVDTVGSQANRLEPIFERAPYAELIPQIVVSVGDKEINLLEAGHRAGDALIRCTDLQPEIEQAFKALLAGNAAPMAKLSPTSLVFGVWDSRGTQAKVTRLIASTVRAFDVRKLTRSAQFIPATEYEAEGLIEPPSKEKDLYSERGFLHVPASGTPGGIIAEGGVRREATLSLAALRLLNAATPEETEKLRRYVLGLALVVFTANVPSYLRQGCNLVLAGPQARHVEEVHPSGERKSFSLTHAQALAYAKAAAEAFGVGESRVSQFTKERAQADIKKAKANKTKSGA